MVAVWKTWNDAVPNWGWGSPGKGQGKPARPAPAENFWQPHCFMLEPLVNHFDSWRSFSFLKFILKSLSRWDLKLAGTVPKLQPGGRATKVLEEETVVGTVDMADQRINGTIRNDQNRTTRNGSKDKALNNAQRFLADAQERAGTRATREATRSLTSGTYRLRPTLSFDRTTFVCLQRTEQLLFFAHVIVIVLVIFVLLWFIITKGSLGYLS